MSHRGSRRARATGATPSSSFQGLLSDPATGARTAASGDLGGGIGGDGKLVRPGSGFQTAGQFGASSGYTRGRWQITTAADVAELAASLEPASGRRGSGVDGDDDGADDGGKPPLARARTALPRTHFGPRGERRAPGVAGKATTDIWASESGGASLAVRGSPRAAPPVKSHADDGAGAAPSPSRPSGASLASRALRRPNGRPASTPSVRPGSGLRRQRPATAGVSHSEIVAWGWNEFGQCGDGGIRDVTDPTTMTRLDDKDVEVVNLSAGSFHSLVVTHTGGVFGWGRNQASQLGMGPPPEGQQLPSNVHVPTLVPALRHIRVVQVACGGFHSLALTDGGRVLAWGAGAKGQLGIVTRHEASNTTGLFTGSPTKIGVRDPAKSRGTRAGLEAFDLRAVGTVHSPLALPAPVGVARIAAGFEYSAAVEADGKLWTWGCGRQGQLGSGARVDALLPQTPVIPWADMRHDPSGDGAPVAPASKRQGSAKGVTAARAAGTKAGGGGADAGPLPGDPRVSQVACADGHTLVLMSDGNVLACGEAGFGRLGIPVEELEEMAKSGVAVASGPGAAAKKRSGAGGLCVPSLCVVRAFCLDNRIIADPGRDSLTLGRTKRDDAGSSGGFESDSSGRGASGGGGGGRNADDEDDDSEYESSSDELDEETARAAFGGVVKARVTRRARMSRAVAVSAGGASSLAVCEDGRLYTWGANDSGQLGVGHYDARVEPTVVPSFGRGSTIRVALADVSQDHVVAVSTTGNVYAWGKISHGRLGVTADDLARGRDDDVYRAQARGVRDKSDRSRQAVPFLLHDFCINATRATSISLGGAHSLLAAVPRAWSAAARWPALTDPVHSVAWGAGIASDAPEVGGLTMLEHEAEPTSTDEAGGGGRDTELHVHTWCGFVVQARDCNGRARCKGGDTVVCAVEGLSSSSTLSFQRSLAGNQPLCGIGSNGAKESILQSGALEGHSLIRRTVGVAGAGSSNGGADGAGDGDGKDAEAVSVRVRDNFDGTYSIWYKTPCSGRYRVNVAIKPLDNGGGPQAVKARPSSTRRPVRAALMSPVTGGRPSRSGAGSRRDGDVGFGPMWDAPEGAAGPDATAPLDGDGHGGGGGAFGSRAGSSDSDGGEPADPLAERTILGSPFYVVVIDGDTHAHAHRDPFVHAPALAASTMCFVSGAALRGMVVGEKARLKLEAKNSDGELMPGTGRKFVGTLTLAAAASVRATPAERGDGGESKAGASSDGASSPTAAVVTARAQEVGDGSVWLEFLPTFTGLCALDIGLSAGPAVHPVKASPWQVRVSPGPTHAPSCTAVGAGVQPSVLSLVRQSFTLTARDEFGNARGKGGDKFLVQLTLAPAQPAPNAAVASVVGRGGGGGGGAYSSDEGSDVEIDAAVNDVGDGTYGVHYCVQKTGRYYVAVLLRRRHIRGSPFAIDVAEPAKLPPDPAKCRVEGPGLEGAIVGEPAAVTIRAFDMYGRPVRAARRRGPGTPRGGVPSPQPFVLSVERTGSTGRDAAGASARARGNGKRADGSGGGSGVTVAVRPLDSGDFEAVFTVPDEGAYIVNLSAAVVDAQSNSGDGESTAAGADVSVAGMPRVVAAVHRQVATFSARGSIAAAERLDPPFYYAFSDGPEPLVYVRHSLRGGHVPLHKGVAPLCCLPDPRASALADVSNVADAMARVGVVVVGDGRDRLLADILYKAEATYGSMVQAGHAVLPVQVQLLALFVSDISGGAALVDDAGRPGSALREPSPRVGGRAGAGNTSGDRSKKDGGEGSVVLLGDVVEWLRAHGTGASLTHAQAMWVNLHRTVLFKHLCDWLGIRCALAPAEHDASSAVPPLRITAHVADDEAGVDLVPDLLGSSHAVAGCTEALRARAASAAVGRGAARMAFSASTSAPAPVGVTGRAGGGGGGGGMSGTLPSPTAAGAGAGASSSGARAVTPLGGVRPPRRARRARTLPPGALGNAT